MSGLSVPAQPAHAPPFFAFSISLLANEIFARMLILDGSDDTSICVQLQC